MKHDSAVAIEKVPLADIRGRSTNVSESTNLQPSIWACRRLPLLAFLSSVLIVLAVSRTPQSLFSDPSWQLKALQQHLAGEAPTFNTLVQADPRDLSQDVQEWISWWPIGTNLLVYPLLRAGMTMGIAIRVLADLALILGSVGFGYWLRLFRLPAWLAMTLAITIPWIRYANLSLFQYAAEGLVFAVCPWLLLGAFRLRSRWASQHRESHSFLAGYGLLLGFAYWMKYSAVFISAGVLVHLRRHGNPALLLSRDVLVTISAVFLAVMTVFSARAMEARYIAAIAIALIPAALECAFTVAPGFSRVSRGILLAAGICYLAIPIAYGGFSVAGKIARTPTAYRAGPSGVYNPLFASMDAASAAASLRADFDPASDLWYLTEPFTAMDLPGRVILRHADFLPTDKLIENFQTSKPVRVHLLLPPWFEQNGKGSIIRGEFLGATNWSSRTLPGMNYIEWTATLPGNRN